MKDWCLWSQVLLSAACYSVTPQVMCTNMTTISSSSFAVPGRCRGRALSEKGLQRLLPLLKLVRPQRAACRLQRVQVAGCSPSLTVWLLMLHTHLVKPHWPCSELRHRRRRAKVVSASFMIRFYQSHHDSPLCREQRTAAHEAQQPRCEF